LWLILLFYHFFICLFSWGIIEISLSMYDNQELNLNEKESKNSKTISMRLRHEFGYSFSYDANGIQDQKEIEEAIKKNKIYF